MFENRRSGAGLRLLGITLCAGTLAGCTVEVSNEKMDAGAPGPRADVGSTSADVGPGADASSPIRDAGSWLDASTAGLDAGSVPDASSPGRDGGSGADASSPGFDAGSVSVTYTDYVLPTSIDTTGATDVSATIWSWIHANVPDGADGSHHSRVRAPAGAVYLLSSEGDQLGFQMKSRHHLTLDGGGHWAVPPSVGSPAGTWVPSAVVKLRTPGAGGFSALFFVESSSDIRITGWTGDGGNPNTGTHSAYDVAHENCTAVYVRAGSSQIEVDSNFFDNWYGFGFLTDRLGSGGTWPDQVSFHHNYGRGFEMGIGIVAGSHINASYNSIVDCSWSLIDFEPENDLGGFADVVIENNLFGDYGWVDGHDNWWLAACPNDSGLGSLADRLTVRYNTVFGKMQSSWGSAGIGSLAVRANKRNPKNDWVIAYNIGLSPNHYPLGHNNTWGGGGLMYINNCNNLQVTDNVQPMDDPTFSAAISGLVDQVHGDTGAGANSGAIDVTTGNSEQ